MARPIANITLNFTPNNIRKRPIAIIACLSVAAKRTTYEFSVTFRMCRLVRVEGGNGGMWKGVTFAIGGGLRP